MTCIVGVVDKGKVYIGADSAALSGWDLCTREDRKVFVNNGFAMGFTTSFRMGQLLAHALKPPQIKPRDNLMRFMSVDFVNAARECLKGGGWASKQNETEKGGDFLVGYKGRLFFISSDYQVAESDVGFHAIGCGSGQAIGVLHVLRPKAEPRKAVLAALTIAEKCSGGVRAPFHIVSV